MSRRALADWLDAYIENGGLLARYNSEHARTLRLDVTLALDAAVRILAIEAML